MKYYVYILQDRSCPGMFKFLDHVFCYRPVYVGKGQGARVLKSMRERGVYYGTLIAEMTEAEALELEREFIKHFSCEHNHIHKPGVRQHNSKAVIQARLDGEFVAEWPSAHAAAEGAFGNISGHSNIAQACRNHASAYGFLWVYERDQIPAAVESARVRMDRRAFNSSNRKTARAVSVTHAHSGETVNYRSLSAAGKALGMLPYGVHQRAKHGRAIKGLTIKFSNK